MSTENPRAKANTERSASCARSEALHSYLDYLATVQEKFAKSAQESRERVARINDALLKALLDGQRAAIATGKRLAAHPQDHAANMKIVIEAATAAQESGLALAKSLYQEQADVAAGLRELWEGAIKSSTGFGDGVKKFSALWPKVA